MKSTALSYVLITPARNEEAFIEQTLRSVVAQTLRPLKWIIVSDGSTDRTDEIVGKYIVSNPWIELLRMPERKERHFGGKVACFNAGFERLKEVPYDIIGNLDADLSFDRNLYALLVSRFQENPRLGVAGPPFTEGNGTYDFRFSSIEHVSGACQLFRRECYEAIGGYTPIKGGGIDVVAVLSARMRGWETRTFTETVCVHHRVMGRAKGNSISAGFRLGEKDYRLGRDPVWQVCRSLYQMTRPPILIGGATLITGYMWAMFRRLERPVPRELVQFQRNDQRRRLKNFALQWVSSRAGKTKHREKGKAGSLLRSP